MVPLPKRKLSKSRKGSRRSHDGLTAIKLVQCSHCGEMRQQHVVCPNCGHYNGKEVIAIEAKKK